MNHIKTLLQILISPIGEMEIGLLKQYAEKQFFQISQSNNSSIFLSPTVQPGQLRNTYILYVTAF